MSLQTRLLLRAPILPVAKPRFQSTLSPKTHYLTQTKSRIGRCVNHGLPAPLYAPAAAALALLGKEWRTLLAGTEGYLSEESVAGLWRQKVVWGEMDSMGHVNNVAYVRYAESARVGWVRNIAAKERERQKGSSGEWEELWNSKGTGMILRDIRVGFKFPMKFPDHVTVLHKLSHMPKADDTAFSLDVMIISELHQRPTARCVEDIVVYDYTKGGKTKIPPWLLESMGRVWEAQEKERKRAEGLRGEVEGFVDELEMGTWKGGAPEDMGGRP